MAIGYFASALSDNISETPEGFLVCHDCTIGRTGWQQYKVADLPQEAAQQFGIDTSRSEDLIDLYRDETDVFDADFLASLEGKPVTDNHPPGFVTPENFTEFARGHIQNVRRGPEPLDSGDWPIISDVLVTAEPLLSKVRNKIIRELSLGYDYSIRKDGDRIFQCDMNGNHLAVVPKGRAGSEARIMDAAPGTTVPSTETATITAPTTKEKQPVKITLRHLLGLGFKEFAKDAEPEALAEAVEAMNEKPANDNKGKDGELPAALEAHKFGADAALDRRKKLHDALDRALDSEGSGTGNGGARDGMENGEMCDADLDAVEKGLSKFFSEEKKEPEHQEDEAEESEAIGQVVDPDGNEEVEVPAGDVIMANDRARAADGAAAVLNALRPFVARTKDSAVKKAFNTAVTNVNKVSRPNSAGSSYSAVAATSRSRARAADSNGADGAGKKPKAYVDLQKAYDAARTGEVK